MRSVDRANLILMKLADTLPEIEDLQNKISKQRLKDMERLYKDNVWNNQIQAGSHLATGGLSLGAGLFGGRFGLDATSSTTIASKFGEAGSTWIRSWETATQGALRRVEHELNKGPEKRYSEFFQQFMRYVETMSQTLGRARLSGG